MSEIKKENTQEIKNELSDENLNKVYGGNDEDIPFNPEKSETPLGDLKKLYEENS